MAFSIFNKSILLFALLTAIFLMVFYKEAKKGTVCFKDNCFDVELAITSEQKRKGLMHREELKEDKGMLFINSEEYICGFWMKNVKFPLDIIWIDKDKKVVFISKNTPSCLKDPCPSVKPDKKAKYVLEIKGGISEKIGLDEGDQLDIIYKQE